MPGVDSRASASGKPAVYMSRNWAASFCTLLAITRWVYLVVRQSVLKQDYLLEYQSSWPTSMVKNGNACNSSNIGDVVKIRHPFMKEFQPRQGFVINHFCCGWCGAITNHCLNSPLWRFPLMRGWQAGCVSLYCGLVRMVVTPRTLTWDRGWYSQAAQTG